MTSREIRQQFCDFFRKKEHEIVPSSPVVPHGDPTLMFTNAGMNQFKDVFLGAGSRPYARAADTQKCIRAGGKHNDLDDVGQDTYHHTFFEMLGNWSFGDYFKTEAIDWAWELLTEVWGIDASRLHATYFEGDPAEGLEPDHEARDLWHRHLPAERVHPGNKKDNFWEMGDTGPCGPCSEIHVDLTPDKSGAALVNAGDANVIELWNLVFIQFNRAQGGALSPLPAKHVDTGMGFERLCAVLNGKKSNYDTDVFTPLFDAIQNRCNAPDYKGTLPGKDPEPPCDKPSRDRKGADESQKMIDVTYRVIADHLRCLTFALTDGAVPSNEGRGYVLRRILRRAVRYGRQYFDMHEPFLCDLVPAVIQHMADIFPELETGENPNRPRDNVKHVAEIVRDEEQSFFKTLERGIKVFEYEVERATALFIAEREYMAGEAMGMPGTRVPIAKEQPDPVVIPAGVAFVLHDTYGFPIDLTILMAQERGIKVDIEGYERLMEEARRKSRGEKTNTWTTLAANFASENYPQTRFIGYDRLEVKARITQTVSLQHYSDLSGGAAFGGLISTGELGAVLFEETPFYAEKGGQIGDTGIIVTASGRFRVEEVRDFNGVVVHIGHCLDGEVWSFSIEESQRSIPSEPETFEGIPIADLPPDLATTCREVHADNVRTFRGRTEFARATVDSTHRIPTMLNHTSTHLLNWALRETLCPPDERQHPHVQQKGSLVDPEKTRFDFSHGRPVSADEISRIESLVNEQIEAGLPVYAASREEDFVNQKEAREINTLRAVFGEKYPDRVRVVSIGAPIEDLLADPNNEKWLRHSVEFCGGTHVRNTREIERFVLTAEESVAKGIRRVVGISGEAAVKAAQLGEELLAEARLLSGRPSPTPGRDGAPDQSSDRDGAGGTTGADVANRLADLQMRVANAVIPITVRLAIRDLLSEVQKRVKDLEKQSATAAAGDVMTRAHELLDSAPSVGHTRIIVGRVPAAGPDALRGAVDWFRRKTDSSAVLLACTDGEKVTLLAGMSNDLVKKGIKAGDLIKEIAPLVGGKGGGRPDMAQGGGTDPDAIPAAIQRATDWLVERVGG